MGFPVMAEDPYTVLGVPRTASEDDVRALAGERVEIGAHSMSHAVLSELDAITLRAEIKGSVDKVTAEMNARCRVFAYPYGGPKECGDREAAVCK